MRIFLINSFNNSKYILWARELSNQIENFGFQTVTVFGGGDGFYCCHLTPLKSIISITENLSDHNAFVGFEKAFSDGHFREESYRNATYIYVHDTCKISTRNFVETINNLPDVSGWVFAQTYGLYNIGISNQNFLLKRAKDFYGVTHIPKDKSIALEEGNTVVIGEKQILPLIFYTQKTLAQITNSDLDKCDFVSVSRFGNTSNKRFVSYIGALSMYKFVGLRASYFVPIWAAACHEIHNEKERSAMVKQFQNLWIPLVPLPINAGN
tara:strand:- start:409 stop:1209 length:801 start_codon:yes stop_codon:yes gene_type:complete